MHGKRIKTERREGAPRRSPFGALKGRRAVSLLLSVALFLSVFFGVAVYPALSAAGDDVGGTQGVSREADPSTMDTYREMLDFLKDSRYAGRLWTDKTVFALGKPSRVSLGSNLFRGFDGKKLRLLDALDGLDGFVTLDADFLEVFSALGSSVAIDEFPSSPIDLVIVIDMSASMGQDTRYAIDSMSDHNFDLDYKNDEPGAPVIGRGWDILPSNNEYSQQEISARTMQSRIENSRIQKTLNAVNDTIDRLMEQNPNNRVSVVLYGAGATAIMPLDHYERNDNNPYLRVTGMEPIYDYRELVYNETYGWIWAKNRDAVYNVEVNAIKGEGDQKENLKKTVSNNVDNEKRYDNPGYRKWVDQYFREIEGQEGEGKNYYWHYYNTGVLFAEELGRSGSLPLRIFDGEKDGKGEWQLKEPRLPNADTYIGYYTNTQGGIYLGLEQLAKAQPTTFTGELESDGATSVIVPRIPAAIIMSDGGANFAFNRMDHWDTRYGKYRTDVDSSESQIPEQDFDQESGWIADGNGNEANGDPEDHSHRFAGNKQNEGNEWYDVYLPDNVNERVTSLYNNSWYQTDSNNAFSMLSSAPVNSSAGVFYSTDSNKLGTSGTTLEVLMTASYMKTAVEKHYKAGWDKAKIPDERRRDLQIFTLSVDSQNVPDWGRMRLYPSLDPRSYPLEAGSNWWSDESKFGPSDALKKPEKEGKEQGYYTLSDIYSGMIVSWQKWARGEVTDAQMNSDRVYLGVLPSDHTAFGVTITNQDVIDNIVYNDGFYDVESAQLDEIFDIIFSRVVTPIFTPVTGQNDLGVSNSVTFMDPIGKYMEVKSVKNLLLFGTLYGISKTAVYSYSFNSAVGENYRDGNLLKEGWYKGDAGNPQYKSPGETPEGSAENAWKAGWVYRINAETASQYVPSLKDINDTSQGENAAVQKMRQTEYTFYRVSSKYTFDANDPNKDPTFEKYAQDSDEFTRWRLNPAYGESNEDVGVDPDRAGAYRLSDLRIWVEDTGDYVDTSLGSGGLQTDSSYDTALWIDVPRYMLPLRTVTVSQDETGGWNYKTNIPADDRTENITPNSPESAAFPLRVFYTVGVAEDMLDSTGRINISRLGQEYLQKNKINTDVASLARGFKEMNDPAGTGIGNIEFFSNWYNPENRYADYVTSQTQYSYGDPAATFSPSTDNRYYIFQNGLPLYKAAYEYKADADSSGGGTWAQVEIQDSTENSKDGDPTRTKFLRDIVAQDLVIDGDPPADTSVAIDAALSSDIKSNLKAGDIVLLKQDRISVVDEQNPFPMTDSYYFMPIEYFVVRGDRSASAAPDPEDTGVAADLVSKCVTRQGAEFGSAHVTSGISDEDMLCWYDASGTFKEVYPFLDDASHGKDYIGYLSENIYDENGQLIPAEMLQPSFKALLVSQGFGDWVVAAKPGALRVGDLAEAAKAKTVEERIYEDGEYPETVNDNSFASSGTPIGGDKWAYDDDEEETLGAKRPYISERFPDKFGDENFQVHYYKGNVTRTSNTYYMPTARSRVLTDTAEPVSLIDAADAPGGSGDEKGVVINTYLGNNGRLWVMDTTLLVTKLVEPPAGMEVDLRQEFHFQVFINGFSGDVDAIVVKYDETAKRWHRQFHYIDLLLDQKLCLRNSDGSPALVDQEGKHIIATTSDGVTSYKYEDGTSYNGIPYYVFIGKNKNQVDVTGENGDALRLYHNMEVHEDNSQYHEVDESVVKRDVHSQTGVITYSVVNAWLFTEEQYENFQLNDDGNYDAPTIGENGTAAKKLDNFEVLTVTPADPTSNAPTEMLFKTPYATQSAYYTKTVRFGPLIPGEGPQGLWLYDTTFDPSGKDDWKNIVKSDMGKYTAPFTLKSGEGLLFTGIPDNVPYLVTERQKRTPGGYRFKSVTHNLLNPGTPDNQTPNAVYTYKEKGGEPDPNGPTAHFDGDGAYSVYDTTSTYEEAAHYVNTLAKPSLAVEKRIGDDKPNTEVKFTFRVTLTAPSGSTFSKDDIDLLHFKLYSKGDTGDTEDPVFTQPEWKDENGADAAGGESIIYADFKLKHNQKVVLYDIPEGTTYVVAETDGGDYLLQRVEDGYTNSNIPSTADVPKPEGDNPIFEPENGLCSVTGTLTWTDTHSGEPEVYLVYYNYLKYGLPTTGGAGARPLFAAGAALLLCAGVLLAVKLCRKAKRKNKTEER